MLNTRVAACFLQFRDGITFRVSSIDPWSNCMFLDYLGWCCVSSGYPGSARRCRFLLSFEKMMFYGPRIKTASCCSFSMFWVLRLERNDMLQKVELHCAAACFHRILCDGTFSEHFVSAAAAARFLVFLRVPACRCTHPREVVLCGVPACLLQSAPVCWIIPIMQRTRLALRVSCVPGARVPCGRSNAEPPVLCMFSAFR